MSKFYITTPIYYVNDKPHIGHAYTTILADVLSRFRREAGDDVFFITGTDEHGQKVFQAARERNVEPQDHCDEMVERFKNLWEKLHIEYDDFIRTTDTGHKEVVKTILTDIYDNGDIYMDEYSGSYCVGCERFYTEKELVDNKCPQHRKELDVIIEKNYFFKMSKYQQQLIDYIKNNPDFIQPEFRKNEVLGFLRQPLGDLCISRPKSRLKWGVEIPFDSDYVTYVWFDALINYISAIKITQDDTVSSKWWPAEYHLIGKDILITHAVYWPTMLFAAGIPLPKTLFARGWWLSDDFKMSKSLGNVVNPLDLIETYGVDPVRYFLMRDMVLGQDANFSLDAFIRRYNSDLANDLGNLAGRIHTLISKHFESKIPEAGELQDEDRKLQELSTKTAEKAFAKIHGMKMNEAIEETLQLVRFINGYMEKMKPWKVVKEDIERTGTILFIAAESLRISLCLLHPIMPVRTKHILEMIGAKNDEFDPSWGGLACGTSLGEFETPFPRIEVEKPKESPQLKKKENKVENNLISIEDFAKVELRTAEVLKAEKVENADKLLKLQIQLGDEKRQIVAGIAEHYQPEELEGKIIVVAANLQPAKIRGIESNGMLLAASKNDSVIVLTVDDPSIGSGAKVS